MKTDTSGTHTGATLQQTATGLAKKVEEVTQSLRENLEATAEVVRNRLPQEGQVGDASNVLTDQLARAARYLQREGPHGVAENMESVIRQYPVQFLLVGAGLGYLLSRLHRS